MGKILIVDDDLVSCVAILTLLKGRGYQLETAHDGQTAIARAEILLPDLILLDVMMPGIDGFEVCRRLRSLPQLREVPIIMLTSLDDRQSCLLGLEAGADDFITKPFDGQELSSRVQTIVRLNRYRTLLEQRENLRLIAMNVIQAQDDERLRISHEIHDDIEPALLAHQVGLEAIQKTISSDEVVLQDWMQTLIIESNQILLKLRMLAQDLRPPLLDTLGIDHALKTCCIDFCSRTRMPIEFEVIGNTSNSSDLINVTLYRVLQDALTSFARYARKVWVTLTADDQIVSLSVQDDGGIGISDEDLNIHNVGIKGIQDRVTLAGGFFAMQSGPKLEKIITVRFLRIPEQNIL